MIFKPLLNCSAASHNCGCDRRGSCAFLFLVVPTVRISSLIRTERANLVEKRDEFCLTVYFGSPKSKSFLWSADMRAKYAFLTIENFIFITFLPLVIGSK